MFALITSILLLASGPVFGALLKRRRTLFNFLDGLVLVAIAGLCLTHLLPEAFVRLGFVSLLLVVGGAFIPYWAERHVGHSHRRPERFVLGLAALMLALHAAIDGAALGVSEGSWAWALPVVAHRFPVSLFLWWTVSASFGKPIAWGALGGVALATVGGYAFAGTLDWHGLPTGVLFVQSVAIGNLLHVVAHQPGDDLQSRKDVYANTLGALVGVALVMGSVASEAKLDATPAPHATPNARPADEPARDRHGHVVPSATPRASPADATDSHGGHAGHDHDAQSGEPDPHLAVHQLVRSVGQRFSALVHETAPALLLGFLAAGLIVTLGGGNLGRRMRGRNAVGSAFRGVVYGLPLPICSCGVVPIYRSLLLKGAPPAAAFAFLIATPELGLDALLLSLPLLGSEMTLARVIAAFAVAMLVGIAMHAAPMTVKPETEEPDSGSDAPPSQRLKEALRYAFVDMFDHLGPWIAAGLVIAAIMDVLVDPVGLGKLAPWLQILAMAIIGTPGYICAAAATPVVAVLMAKGLSAGACLTFLIAGPATNVTTFGVLSDLHGRRAALKTLALIVTLAILAGFLTNLLVTEATSELTLDHHHSDHINEACTLALVLLSIASLLRIGPRGALIQLGLGDGEHNHGAHGDEQEGHCAASEPCSGADSHTAGGEPTAYHHHTHDAH